MIENDVMITLALERFPHQIVGSVNGFIAATDRFEIEFGKAMHGSMVVEQDGPVIDIKRQGAFTWLHLGSEVRYFFLDECDAMKAALLLTADLKP